MVSRPRRYFIQGLTEAKPLCEITGRALVSFRTAPKVGVLPAKRFSGVSNLDRPFALSKSPLAYVGYVGDKAPPSVSCIPHVKRARQERLSYGGA